MISDEKKAELLNDHYKDSFSYQYKYIKNRDRFFQLSLLFAFLIFIQYLFPKDITEALQQVADNKFSLKKVLNANYIVSALWLFEMIFYLRYIQCHGIVEKAYDYIHELEDNLRNLGIPIAREGKAYEENYPLIKKWFHCLYTRIIPLMLVVLLSFKIYAEWSDEQCSIGHKLLDSVLFGITLITLALNSLAKYFNPLKSS